MIPRRIQRAAFDLSEPGESQARPDQSADPIITDGPATVGQMPGRGSPIQIGTAWPNDVRQNLNDAEIRSCSIGAAFPVD